MIDGVGEGISAVLKFFTGKDGWRFWFASTIVLWLIFYNEKISWVIYPAIFCSIILVLIFLSWCYNVGKRVYNNYETKKRLRLNKQFKEQESKDELFREKNVIWQFFYVAEASALDCAASMIDFATIPHNPYTRFLQSDKLNCNITSAIYEIVNYMTIKRDYYSPIELINLRQTHQGWFLEFDPYFFDLLVHYKNTGTKEFL